MPKLDEKFQKNYYRITALDLITILYCVTRLKSKEEYLDAYQSYEDFLKRWQPFKLISVHKDMLEKALYCAREIDKHGEFWTPRENMDCEAWIRSLLAPNKKEFHQVFNLIVKDEMKERVRYGKDREDDDE